MNKASCLSLLSNAVLVWNTVRISEIVERLRAAGEQILDADMAPCLSSGLLGRLRATEWPAVSAAIEQRVLSSPNTPRTG